MSNDKLNTTIMQLRQYQEEISTDAAKLLEWVKIAYLCMEVRTGKTLTALATCEKYGAKDVLFITKKKAKSSIKKDSDEDPDGDYDKLSPSFKMHLINYEQIHNLSPDYKFDIVILDEAHCIGQFPKPAQRTKKLKALCNGKPIIYLSGTPTPESFSQIFHQLWVSSFSPFKHTNFYGWATEYVIVKKKYFYNRELNDYGFGIQEKIDAMTKHLFIAFTQEDAGFTQPVQEHRLYLRMANSTYALAKKLKKDKVYVGINGEEILADTAVKLMNKLHQVFSGTVITEMGEAIVFDNSKAVFIKEKFQGKKIAIFYKFKAEGKMLTEVFGESNITSTPELFNASSDLVFISQIQSGREGTNLSTADCLIMFNIDFSSLSYQQAKARIQTKDRVKEALVYWVFSYNGIEPKVYESVINKQDFTLAHFKKAVVEEFKTTLDNGNITIYAKSAEELKFKVAMYGVANNLFQ